MSYITAGALNGLSATPVVGRAVYETPNEPFTGTPRFMKNWGICLGKTKQGIIFADLTDKKQEELALHDPEVRFGFFQAFASGDYAEALSRLPRFKHTAPLVFVRVDDYVSKSRHFAPFREYLLREDIVLHAGDGKPYTPKNLRRRLGFFKQGGRTFRLSRNKR